MQKAHCLAGSALYFLYKLKVFKAEIKLLVNEATDCFSKPVQTKTS